MKKCVIFIPVYTDMPGQNELLSFSRCFCILSNHPIKVVAPNELNLEAYESAVPSFDVIRIDRFWQESITNYNELKKSLYFYQLFEEYEYVLTYELDAWVFRDELLLWCNKGWDYIGAPWFDGWAKGGSAEITGIGNSGFSLRNTDKSISILRRIKRLKSLRSFWFASKLQAIWRFNRMIAFFEVIFNIKSNKYLGELLLGDIHNEDHYWGEYVSQSFTDYKVATIEEAINFSFEVNPSLLFELNNQKLPFGCHAWEKYDPEFWESFIKSSSSENL